MGSESDEETDPFETLASWAAIIVLLWALRKYGCKYVCCCCGCFCFRCCSRRSASAEKEEKAPRAVLVEGEEVSVSFLRPKKDMLAAYTLWWGAGVFGAHHFYLDRIVHGVFAAGTLNFFFIGWVLDAFSLPYFVSKYNGETADAAPYDPGSRRLCCRLPLFYGLLLTVASISFCQFPSMLHFTGIVDLESLMAGTERNPYDMLGVEPSVKAAAAEDAYDILMRAELPQISGKPCDEKCRKRKKELGKAIKFVRGDWRHSADRRKENRRNSKKRTNVDTAWDDWADYIGLQWSTLGRTGYNAFASATEDSDDGSSTNEGNGQKQRTRSQPRDKSNHRDGDPEL